MRRANLDRVLGCLNAGEPADSIPEFAEAQNESARELREHRDRPETWLHCAQLFWATGNVRLANRFIKKGLLLGRNSFDTLCHAAEVFEKAGEYDRAEACIKRALRRNPNSTRARLQHAWLLWIAHSIPAPQPAFGKASPIAPPFSRMLRPYAKLLWAVDRLPAAVRALEKVLDSAPDAPHLCLNVTQFLIMTGEFDRAEACLGQMLRRDPRSPQALAGLAQIQLWRGRAKQAVRSAKAGLQHDPSSTLALRCLGGALTLLGRHGEALRALERLLRLDPHNSEAHIWRCEIYRHQGLVAAAQDEIESAQQHGHEPLALEIYRVLLGLRRGRLHGAFLRPLRRTQQPDSLSRALERVLLRMGGNRSWLEMTASDSRLCASPRPGNEEPYHPEEHDLAITTVCQFLQWRVVFRPMEEVLAEFRSMMNEFPNEPQPFSHYGELMLWLGRYQEAEEIFQKVRTTEGARKWWAVAWGGIEMLRGFPRRALDQFEKARQIGAPDHSIGPWSAECLRRIGDYKGALSELEKVPATFPYHVSIWVNLALALAGLRRRRELSVLFHALSVQTPDLLREAAHATGIDPQLPRGRQTPSQMTRTLEKVLDMMRGNRTAVCATYFLPNGRFRVARMHGC